jgi:hypothetical protein
MSRPLPLITVLLVALALTFAGLIAKELTTVPRAPASRSQPAASPAAAAPAAPGPVAAPNYTVVASRNLFSPTRSEAPPAPPPSAAPPPPVLPKPNLFGVVLIEGTPVAYLEDPVSKRVARYRVGDAVAGGTVKSIESDTVQLMRPEGQVTVRLHDPTRPRAGGPPAAAQATPGFPGVNPGAPMALPGNPIPLGVAQPGPTGTNPSITHPRPLQPSTFGRFPSRSPDAPSAR